MGGNGRREHYQAGEKSSTPESYMWALGIFTKDQEPLRWKLRVHIHPVSYLMGDTGGIGFGSVLWVQGII